MANIRKNDSIPMKIEYLPKFEQQFKKLPKEIQEAALKKESFFRQNPFHPLLKTHKLSGRLEGFWAFWVKYKYRIIFEFAQKNMIRFHKIGDHDIYA